MYKHILVPVLIGEGNDPHAAFEAAKLLADGGAEITVLHIMEAMPGFVNAYIEPEVMARTKADARAALARVAAKLPGSTPVLIEGHAGRDIVEFAGKHGVDCIVIASHRPGLSNYLIGSTADRVVRHAQCAVHVIR